jgi:hypothetical protein
MSNKTAYGTIDNIVSAWPAGIKYSPSSSKYVYSVTNTYQISALSHLHVVDFDLPSVIDPNVMYLTLPVMANLPLESRIYFFYVTHAEPGDMLTFVPVSGSGNTVNGNALYYTFALTGNPELLICLGVNDNYIIQSFGLNNSTQKAFPTELWEIDVQHAPATTNPSFFTDGQTFGVGPQDACCTLVLDPPIEIVPGMENYLIPNQVVTGTEGSYAGFLCNQSGWYNISCQAKLQYSGNPVWDSLNCPFIGEFDGTTGAALNYYPLAQSSFKSIVGESNVAILMSEGSIYVPLTSGYIYCFGFTYQDVGLGLYAFTWRGSNRIIFQYIAPISPGNFTTQSNRLASNTDSAIFSKISNPISGSKAAQIQKSQRHNPIHESDHLLSSSSSSSSSLVQPSFSLQDMERMINRAIDARSTFTPSSGVVNTSSSSSTISSSSTSPSSSSSSSSIQLNKRKGGVQIDSLLKSSSLSSKRTKKE